MSGNKIIDTNILIHLSKQEISLDDFSDKNSKLFISIITYMEALGYDFKREQEQIIINKLCAETSIVKLDDAIVEKVIEIRKKIRIKLPDAIIAASAIVFKMELITANEDDFKNVPGLRVVNPFKAR